MYLLGLIHDIGHLYGKEGHEQSGAEFRVSTVGQPADPFCDHVPASFIQERTNPLSDIKKGGEDYGDQHVSFWQNNG